MELLLGNIERKQDCRLCAGGEQRVGTIGRRAAIIYKTGDDPRFDWFLTLQRNVSSDPETGFGLMLMPIGHLEAFCQAWSNTLLAQNYGVADALANYAMQVVRQRE